MNWNKRVCSERRKSHFRGSRFQTFPGEDTPGPPYRCEVLCMHQSAQELDPPLVNVRESDSVLSANAVNSTNSRETAMTPTVEVLAEMPTQASTNDSKVSSNTRASNIMQGLQNVCRCDVLAADLEGVKLDIVIMQNDIESKIHAANSTE